MAATVLVVFTLYGEERNTNEPGVVVHTRNPSRLETRIEQYHMFKASFVLRRGPGKLGHTKMLSCNKTTEIEVIRLSGGAHWEASASEAEAGRTGP